jgi:hypothetical protein
MHGRRIVFTQTLHWPANINTMNPLYLKHLALHLAGLGQAGFGFLTRQHRQWIKGRCKLLLAQTYLLQYRIQRANSTKPVVVRSAVSAGCAEILSARV